jgi:NADH:ubiquinone reductase (non-electrogenic)
MTPINAVPPPNSPPLPPPSSSGIPPVNPAVLTSGGIPPMNSSGSAGGGKKKRKGFFRRVGQIFGYGSIAAMASGGYYVYYANHPPEQLAYDASKKTIVILGSGWGSTALLDSIDTTEYNVVVISPYNYFLFTPLLPSVTVGTLNARSITQPTRHVVRYKNREVQVLEAKATKVNAKNKTVTFEGANASEGEIDAQEIKYDYLVYGVGSENQTFGIEGVKKHGLFLKELGDAELIRRRLMDW